MTLKEGLEAVPTGERYGEVIRHGNMHAGLYAPIEGEDTYLSEQDIVYIVVSGAGLVHIGSEKMSFTRGDLLLVPAQTEHGFDKVTPDLAVWAVNWGPEST
jgi:mannose-6-phosphate isomerase-like protein (cupin superfamily)